MAAYACKDNTHNNTHTDTCSHTHTLTLTAIECILGLKCSWLSQFPAERQQTAQLHFMAHFLNGKQLTSVDTDVDVKQELEAYHTP